MEIEDFKKKAADLHLKLVEVISNELSGLSRNQIDALIAEVSANLYRASLQSIYETDKHLPYIMLHGLVNYINGVLKENEINSETIN